MENNVKWTDVATSVFTAAIAVLVFILVLSSAGFSIEKLGFDANVWVSIAASVIALCALIVSVHQVRANNYHNRLMVRPSLTVIRQSHSTSMGGLGITNNGIGPAIVKSILMEVNGKLVEVNKQALEDFIKLGTINDELAGTQNFSFDCTEIGNGTFILPNATHWILSTKLPSTNPAAFQTWLATNLERISLTVIYQTLYGDTIVSNSTGDFGKNH